MKTRRELLGLAAGAALAPLALPAAARAQAAKTINVGFTSLSAADWISFAANKLGFFTANGVQPSFTVTGSAAGNAQQLTANAIDVAGISSTQLIEAIQGGAPLVGVADRTQTAPYVILGRKGMTSIKQLAGKIAIVGGPNDITRIMMDRVLTANGVKLQDVTYTFAGGTPERFAALISGTVDASILLPPFQFRATSQGYPILAKVASYFPAFPLDLIGANATWAKAHSETLVAYFRGYLQAVRWIYDPANHDRALQILAESTNTSQDDAAKTYEVYVKERVFSQTAQIPLAGMQQVIDTLAKLDVLKPPLPPPSKFVDNHYMQGAADALRGKR